MLARVALADPLGNAAIEESVVATLTAALDLRCLLHRERAAGRLGVPGYLVGLRAVRAVERLLEPLRTSEHSLAYELAVRDRTPAAVPAEAMQTNREKEKFGA